MSNSGAGLLKLGTSALKSGTGGTFLALEPTDDPNLSRAELEESQEEGTFIPTLLKPSFAIPFTLSKGIVFGLLPVS